MKEKNWIKIIPGKNPQIRVDSVKKIPICINQKSYNNQIIGLVDQILKAKQLNPMVDTSSLDLEIDKLVYQIYGLTEEEINIVESNL